MYSGHSRFRASHRHTKTFVSASSSRLLFQESFDFIGAGWLAPFRLPSINYSVLLTGFPNDDAGVEFPTVLLIFPPHLRRRVKTVVPVFLDYHTKGVLSSLKCA